MFRPMRRFKQQMTEAECFALLRMRQNGVLAVSGDGGYPYAVPISFVLDEENGRLYFHGAPEGHKLDALRASDKASLCVLSEPLPPAEGKPSWSHNYDSVIVFGRIREVEDLSEKEEKVRLLGNKFSPDPYFIEDDIARNLARVCVLELAPEHISGKHVNES